MSRPELVIPVADLERGGKHVEFVLSEAWLRRALEDTDATVSTPGKLDVTLSKNGPSVLVRGQLTVDLTMACVVTLDPVPVPVRAEILLMLSPASGATTEHEGHVARRKPRPPKAEAPGAPEKARQAPERAGRGKGPAKAGGADGHWEETPLLDEETAGQDTYDGHEIALDGFVREFLILELPMFPRRSDLPTDSPAANPPLPAGSQPGGDKPLDPRLSPLAELKSRLEKIKKE
ncbi:MAG TPA: DUF177 domain-containing protein [Polyangiaceae bacterium]|nr:DUF177 domain-containing protein [Polyangiaceae bacterium]